MRYVVRFMKHVTGDNGCQADICQRSLEIDAVSKSDALDIAKQRFCEAEKLYDWKFHADRIEMVDADLRS